MAQKGRLVSIKIVADRLMRNPVLKDLSWEFIVDNAIEVMRILETPALFVSKQEAIGVVNYKGKLPIDIMQVTGVFRQDTPTSALIPLRTGTDTLHNHYDAFNSASAGTAGGETYTMNNSRIFTNFETGTVVIAYRAIAMDEECYPLVLDNAVLLRCIESYIKYRWFDILNDMDQISDRKFNKAEVDYLANVAQADSNLKLPSDDEMETLVNQITQLIPSREQFQSRFQFLGAQEYLRIH